MEEAMNIAKAKDLDVLLAQLKGDSTDELLQAVEDAEKEGEEEAQPELPPIQEAELGTEESKSII